jgi:hypothetical protein
MTELGFNPDDALTGKGQAESSSSGQRKMRPSVGEPHTGVVEIILSLLEDDSTHQEIEVFAFQDDARDAGKVIPEEVHKELNLPDEVDTFSWGDFFGMDLSEYEYVGYPPRDREGEGVTYEEGWDLSEFTGDLTGETKTVLNGHFADEIQERFGPEEASADEPVVEVAIRCGRESDHDDSFEEAHKYQRFYIRETDKTPERVLKQRMKAGDISESEYEELVAQYQDESED